MRQAASRGFVRSFFCVRCGPELRSKLLRSNLSLGLGPKIIGIDRAIITVILVLTTPLFVKYALRGSIAIIAADVGLAALALIYLGFASPFMFQLSGWALIITGVPAIIMGAGGILTSAGMAFPSWVSRLLSLSRALCLQAWKGNRLPERELIQQSIARASL